MGSCNQPGRAGENGAQIPKNPKHAPWIEEVHVYSRSIQLCSMTTQMNLSTKQKQTHRHREQTCGCQGGTGVGEGRAGSVGLADANYYIQDG